MEELLKLYAKLYNVEFTARLGEGKDGQVFQTATMSAVKFLHEVHYYNREIRAYRLLKELQITRIAGFKVPELVRDDDTIWAIEMTIVRPPFILDFVSAHTDEEIEWMGFTEDVVSEREAFWQERFGERWLKVSQIRDEFHRQTGLTLLDLSHNNIRFE
jgi:hypothetical protein